MQTQNNIQNYIKPILNERYYKTNLSVFNSVDMLSPQTLFTDIA